MKMTPEIEAYVAKVQQLNDELYAKEFPKSTPPIIRAQFGKKYVKILSDGAAHSFVDAETGDILKAASWKAPAKGVRGNIRDLTRGFNAYGAYQR